MNVLTPETILALILGYFAVLIGISFFTGKDAGNDQFFLAGRKSPWYLVAFGMVGATLSGVTFISIPGVVGAGGVNQSFSYMQMVFGYLFGYLIIAHVLMPLYYKLNLTSIYVYLEKRLGIAAYKTGAAYFLISRIIGASFRLYLVAMVLQGFVLGPFGFPFWGTVVTTIVFIWVYTFRGGINTIVWTDTLQTTFLLTAVVMTILFIGKELNVGVSGIATLIQESDYTQLFFFEGGWNDPNNFFKQFFGGMLITIVMTGLDQDMMQKNLSCKNIKEAQMNMHTFSVVLLIAKFLFLCLGVLLYIYAAHIQMDLPAKSDQLYPTLALQQLPAVVGVFFVLGLVAATYSSADSALTALTTSVCIDFLNFEKRSDTEERKKQIRFGVHVLISLTLVLVILLFSALNNDAVISQLFKISGYTYGPLLGLFAFGMATKFSVNNRLVILVCVLAPILTIILDFNSAAWFNGFQFGFLNIALNGLLTFVGLWLISKSKVETLSFVDS